MKLGIIGAMSVEVETLCENMHDVSVVERADMMFYQGILEGIPAVVVVCGVGKVNAAMCVQILCDCFGVTHVINTGIAGSLCAELDIGDLVISKDAMYHDFTCHDLNPNYVVGQVPGLSILRFPADEKLIVCAKKAAEKTDTPGRFCRACRKHRKAYRTAQRTGKPCRQSRICKAGRRRSRSPL